MLKKLFIPVILILLVLSIVSAQEEQAFEDETGGFNGAPSWDFFKTRLSFIDKFRASKENSQIFTIVSGALCSTYADWSKSSVVSTSQSCWDNKNGGSPSGTGVEHI